MTARCWRDLIAWMRLSICSLLTGLYQTHRMGLMQISGFGGAEIVGGENYKNPRIDLRPHELEDFILGGLLLSLTQHR